MAADFQFVPLPELLSDSPPTNVEQQAFVEHELTGLDGIRETYGFSGEGQTVVVIDSGIAYDHEALGGGLGSEHVVVGGWDFTEENDADPYDDGPLGAHGTHVAGIIASRDDTYTGVAPGVDLVALRVFNDAGEGYFSWVEKALDWVHENKDAFENPITTVNLSIGTDVHLDTVPDWAVLEDELAQLAADGIFISVAAGNDFFGQTSPGLSYPAVSSYVVPVAAVDDDGSLSDFSQRADTVIAAPGRSIWSTIPDYVGDLDGRPDDYAALSGTSMAAPYVAGASVLIREALQFTGATDITQQTLYEWIRDTADQIYDPVTGASYHRLNVGRAMDAILPDDDYGSTFTAAADLGAIGDGFSLSGLIGQLNDADYFQFTAAATGRVSLSVEADYQLDARWDISQLAISEGDAGSTVISFDVVGGESYSFGLSTAAGLGSYTVGVAFEASPELVDWGRIEAIRHDAVRLGLHAQSFTLTATRDALLTIEALFDASQGDVELELYDSAGRRIAIGQTGEDGQRLDVAVERGAEYELRASGHGAVVDFRATNLVQQKGTSIVVHGTAEGDAFQFRSATEHLLSVNGVDYRFSHDEITAFRVYGRGGEDSVVFFAGDDASTVRVQSGWSQLRGDGYSASAFDMESVAVVAEGGDHTVDLYTTAGDDNLVVRPGDVQLQSETFQATITGVRRVRAHGQGGNDRVRVYDTDGDDALTAWNDTVRLRGDSFRSELFGFDRVMVFADQGNDTAVIYHTVFNGTTTTPALSVLGFDTYSHRFLKIPSQSDAGDESSTAGTSTTTSKPDESQPATPGLASPPSRVRADSDAETVRAAVDDAMLELTDADPKAATLVEQLVGDPSWKLALHEIWNRWSDADDDGDSGFADKKFLDHLRGPHTSLK